MLHRILLHIALLHIVLSHECGGARNYVGHYHSAETAKPLKLDTIHIPHTLAGDTAMRSCRVIGENAVVSSSLPHGGVRTTQCFPQPTRLELITARWRPARVQRVAHTTHRAHGSRPCGRRNAEGGPMLRRRRKLCGTARHDSVEVVVRLTVTMRLQI